MLTWLLARGEERVHYTYDAFGRVTTRTIAPDAGQHRPVRQHTYLWDGEDRLLAVTDEKGRRTCFAYDAIGRRIATWEQNGADPGRSGALPRPYEPGRANEANAAIDAIPAHATRFLWDGLRLVREHRGNEATTYLYDPDQTYTPLARWQGVVNTDDAGQVTACSNGRLTWFQTDLIGTPHTVFDKHGRIEWQAKHSVWGQAEVTAGAGEPQPLRFPGQYHDASTGLHYNTFRYYDPETGRYLSPDPIGLDGGFNLYGYVQDPLSWMDPWGWDWNYRLVDSEGKVYYHGRASDSQSMDDVARRHGKTSGSDGARFGEGDTMERYTDKGTKKIQAQGVEGVAVNKNGTIGRRGVNGDKVRGNNIEGVNQNSKRGKMKMDAGKAELKGRNPNKMPALETRKGGTSTC